MKTETERRAIDSPRHTPFLGLVLWLLSGIVLLSSPAIGAGPPEVLRVRVPSEQVSERFPPGTELQGLAADDFEALVASARAGYKRRSELSPPRLLRARHFARWDSDAGLLLGRSELVVEPSSAGPAELVLDPWSPAIEGPDPDDATPQVRACEDGRVAVRVVASTTETATIALRWQLRARPSSSGRGFTLGLPATETARLELDLPDGWIPEGPPGVREALESGTGPHRQVWRFDGPGGPIDLQLRERSEGRDPHRDARIWVSGPTRIDLLETSANWTTEWSVEAGPRGPRQFAVELDAGLELIDVTGPGVDEYQAEAPEGSGSTRVTVRLAPDVNGPTSVSIRALARVPAEGAWTVPAARPLDALWIGGTTSVHLDASRVLEGCRERAGRRIAPPTAATGDPYLLVFEARAPSPVAQLDFRKPGADVSAEVRGQVLLGSTAPRLESQITWRVHRGRLLDLDVDLPPTWVPDRVRIAGVDEPPAWHPEVQPGGGVRVRVIPSEGASGRGPLVLTLEATSTIAVGRGPLDLPRVRPVGARVTDELWMAWTDAGLMLRPTSARGLTWVDPRLVLGDSANDEGTGGLRASLAWRWIAERAGARVDREQVETQPSGGVELRATVDRKRVRYEWRIDVHATSESLSSVPIAVSDLPADLAPGDWHFSDAATGLELRRRPIDERRCAALGLPVTGQAWELVLPHPRRGGVTIRSWLERPWGGRGPLPLLALPERIQARGTVVIEVDRSMRSTVEATGLRALDPAVVSHERTIGAPSSDEGAGNGLVPYRLAHAFGYNAPGGRLELRTEDLEPSRTGGVIREAILTTYVQPQGSRRHHLTLRIADDRAQSLDLSLPVGAVLARVRRDGQTVVPTRSSDGKGLSIPLAPQHQSRTYGTITLDYLTGGESETGEGVLRPERPTTSLPCLSFCWEIAAPEPWAVADVAPGLVATEPLPTGGWWPWPFVRDGTRGFLARIFRRPAPTSAGDAMLRALDARVVATRPDEVTLGEWFTRWDSGTVPLVIDRLALASSGWGPRSRAVPPRFATSRSGAARAALRPLGLTVVPIGGTLLITDRGEAPDRRGGPIGDPGGRSAWEAVLREAVAWGSDRSDRFQSVTRWRGETTPKMSIRGEIDESEPRPEGWRSWRFVATDWPGPEALVHLIDERRRMSWGGALGLAILLAGIAGRRFPARRRAPVLVVVLAATLLALSLCPGRVLSVVLGALAGELAVVFLWLGRALPGRERGRARDPRGSSTFRLHNPVVDVALYVATSVALVGMGSRLAVAERDADPPILALFPYDGPPDPDRRPDRVILREQDVRRLQELAAIRRVRPNRGVRVLSATHRVSWQGERNIVVETELDLSRGDGVSWTLPVEDTREITATLDGRAVPIQIQAEGRTAAVWLSAAEKDEGRDTDRQRLRVRRIVNARHNASDDLLRLAVNPVVNARVMVEPVPGRTRIDVVSARGRVGSRGGEGGVEGILGPADRLEVRWSSGDETELRDPAGTVEGLLLWDAEPAGDHVQALLTYRRTGGTSTIRLGLAPGLVLRPVAIPGLVDAHWQGTDARPEWVASVDPPLPDGATISLEFWRTAPDPPTAERSLPRIEPLGVERYSGMLGFRRPADWLGRLTAVAGSEPLTDEAFVKAWGSLSEEPLTLAGTSRFLRTPTVTLSTGPPADHWLVDPEVQLAIEPGRLTMDLKASLSAVSGRCEQVELGLPPGLEIIAIQADGLTDWSRRTPDRLRLRFDGARLNRRELRIQAWLPVPSDPLAANVAPREADVLWPRWSGAEARAGTLTIVSSTRFQLTPPAGMPPPAPNLAGAAGAGTNAPYRASYRVDRPEALGRLTWDVEPPRVGVLVQSQLTILPDVAEWTAVLRYDVSGGALEAVHLRLPSTWAESARLKVEGDAHHLSTETRGSDTYWMIRPEYPIWGSQRVIVRGALPLQKTGVLTFPDLAPLGRGVVDSYLALVDASGRELVPEPSPGLQPVVDETRFRDEEFSGPQGITPSVFHVRRETWSLKVRRPGQSRPEDSADDQARVTSADLTCTLRPDGSLVGLACYDVVPRSGPFLSIGPPDHSEPLWASVNNTPAPTLRDSQGRWLIPLGEESVGQIQVRLIWKLAPSAAPDNGVRTLPLPGLIQSRVPTFLTIHAPNTIDLKSPDATFESVPRERLEIARVEWYGRRIVESLGKLDRSSQRDCETLISNLVQFELFLRDAQRSSDWSLSAAVPSRDAHLHRLQERAQIARTALEGAIRKDALDEFTESARIHLGLVADDPDSATLEIPEPIASVRIRRLRTPYFFQGESIKDRTPSLTWSTIPGRRFLDRLTDWALVLFGAIAAALAVYLVTRKAEQSRWLGPATWAAAVVALAIAAGPLPCLAGLALSWLGRAS